MTSEKWHWPRYNKRGCYYADPESACLLCYLRVIKHIITNMIPGDSS